MIIFALTVLTLTQTATIVLLIIKDRMQRKCWDLQVDCNKRADDINAIVLIRINTLENRVRNLEEE